MWSDTDPGKLEQRNICPYSVIFLKWKFLWYLWNTVGCGHLVEQRWHNWEAVKNSRWSDSCSLWSCLYSPTNPPVCLIAGLFCLISDAVTCPDLRFIDVNGSCCSMPGKKQWQPLACTSVTESSKGGRWECLWVEEGRDPKSEPSKLLKGNRILMGFH